MKPLGVVNLWNIVSVKIGPSQLSVISFPSTIIFLLCSRAVSKHCCKVIIYAHDELIPGMMNTTIKSK